MTENEKTWARIEAILSDIEQTQAAIPYARQPDDRESLDIIYRLERKLLAGQSETRAKQCTE